MKLAKRELPIGTIIPWAKSFTGVPQGIDDKWRECDGTTLDAPGSPLDGVTLPSLNSGNRLMRGNSTSGSTGGSSTHSHTFDIAESFTRFVTGTVWADSNSGTTGTASNYPAYYDVVFLIKVR